jgi:hypothetical protein
MNSPFFRVLKLGLIIMASMMLLGCGNSESKAYGLWMSTSQYNGYAGTTIYYSVIELTKDTYKSNILDYTQEHPVTYEKNGDRIIVKNIASGQTHFVLQNITGDSMTDVSGGSPTVYKKVTEKEVEEIKAEIKQSRRRR